MNDNLKSKDLSFLGYSFRIFCPDTHIDSLYQNYPGTSIKDEPEYQISISFNNDIETPKASSNWYKMLTGRLVFDGSLVFMDFHGYIIRLTKINNAIKVDFPDRFRRTRLPEAVLDTALMLLLKDKGLYPVHASGGSLKGKNLIFAGKSGSGKSTLAYRVYEAGGAVLSDDHIYLKMDGPRIFAKSYHRTILLREKPGDYTIDKIRFDLSAARPDAIIEEMLPDIVVFPELGNVDKPSIKELTPSEAAIRLLPLTLPPQTIKDFSLIAKLGQQCKSVLLTLPSAGEIQEKTHQILNKIIKLA